MTELGHGSRTLSFLQLKCKGCEWKALASFKSGLPRQIDCDLNFQQAAGIASTADLMLVQTILGPILQKGNPQRWKILQSTITHTGKDDAVVLPQLMQVLPLVRCKADAR